jgi:acetyl esterase
MTSVIDDTIAGPHGPIPIRRYFPAGNVTPASTATVVWIHGGAFVSGGLDQRETHEVARALAERGFRVVTVAYRLVTRFPFDRRSALLRMPAANRYPIPLDDVVAVVQSVQAEDAAGVILGGASAGACLAASAVLRLAYAGAEPLRGAFFAYGLFHASHPAISDELHSRLRGRRRFTHTRGGIDWVSRNYAGSRQALLEPFAFAGGHDLAGFPSSLLIDADHDAMRASGEQFADELRAAGVPVEYHVPPNTSHAFLHRPRDPGFANGIQLISGWAAQQ